MGKQSSWMGMAVFKRKPLLTLDFLRYPEREFRRIAVFGALLWFCVRAVMHASMIGRDCIRHWPTSPGSRTRWGGGENAWYERLCLGYCSQDCGVGIQSLGLTELSRVALGNDHGLMISCLEAKHCPTVLVTLFYFLHGLLQMMMKAPSNVCRSSLEGSIDFQQTRKSENAWHDKKGRGWMLF